MLRSVMVTGGAGFIGSAVCRRLLASGHRVINVDKLTYSGRQETVAPLSGHPNYHFYHSDICDGAAMLQILRAETVDTVMHLAAESHVDRSIDEPEAFVTTNVVGTFRLLSATLEYWQALPEEAANQFRFHHISTDEVFGDLPFDDSVFDERTAYDPSSPYSASKAASDHFVRAWHKTYGLPVVLSNCSNNYGPYHFPEKLIPLIILNANEGRPLPIYGNGENVRDWLFVEDHARALELVATRGEVGQTYVIGGRQERTNLAVVQAICDLLDNGQRLADGRPRRSLIQFVTDRPGHDQRYAIDPSKIEHQLGWRAQESFESGLAKTIDWFLSNETWWRPIRENAYAGERLGNLA